MIDLGVSKLALIAVVALIVVGPERLPKVARMAGPLFGRAQRYMAEVRSEVNRQIELDEFKKLREASADAMKEMLSRCSLSPRMCAFYLCWDRHEFAKKKSSPHHCLWFAVIHLVNSISST